MRVLALLLACVEPDIERPPAALQVREATFAGLAVEKTTDLAERTLVERTSSLRFADGGPVAGAGAALDLWEEFPVVEADSGVRVAVESEGVRLLPWLDREDLRVVVAETTWIGANGHRVPEGAPGVQVRAGAGVDLEGDAPRITFPGPYVSLDLPIADGLLDEVSRPSPLAAAGPADRYVRDLTPLTDDHGRLLAALSSCAVHVVQEDGSRALVERSLVSRFGDAPGLVRGWVPTAAFGAPREHFGSGGWLCGGFDSSRWGGSGGPVALHPDQLLYDAPDGDIVGVVTRPTTRLIDGDAGEMPGWTAILADTAWGPVTVWVAEAGPTLPDLTAPDDTTPASHVPAAEAEARAQAEAEARLDAFQVALTRAGSDRDALRRVLADFDQRE